MSMGAAGYDAERGRDIGQSSNRAPNPELIRPVANPASALQPSNMGAAATIQLCGKTSVHAGPVPFAAGPASAHLFCEPTERSKRE